MQLFIEKGFLDPFLDAYLLHPGIKTRAQEVVYKMFTEYEDVEIFFDFDFTAYSQENVKAHKLVDHIDNFSKVDFEKYFHEKDFEVRQTLVFCEEEAPWFETVLQKGAMCFSHQNYEQSINTILTKIDNSRRDLFATNYKHDLSSYLKTLAIFPTRSLSISDNYIFGNGAIGNKKQNVKHNISPLLEALMKNNPCEIGSVKIFSQLKSKGVNKKEDVREECEQLYNHIKNDFSSPDFELQFFNLHKGAYPNNLHDRIIMTDFYSIECGIGFDNIEAKKNICNSEIRTYSVFDLYSYNRIKRLSLLYAQHEKLLEEKEAYRYYLTKYPLKKQS